MRRLFLLIFVSCLVMMTANAQDAQKYEVTGYMPVFFEQMKQKLTYPMAYENSGIKKFGKWKKKAREIVYQEMQE